MRYIFLTCILHLGGVYFMAASETLTSPDMTSYVHTYYPKAYVVCEEYFAGMNADQIDGALTELMSVLGDKIWFYFQNEKKGFTLGEYWENVIEQCRIIASFLQRTRVNPDDKSIIPKDLSFHEELLGFNDGVPLLSYFKSEGKRGHYDFYAFYFDYLVKMFNEGIRFQLISQSYRYERRMERVMAKLRGSLYESRYQEVITRGKELISLLRQRLGLEDLYLQLDQANGWDKDETEKKS